MIWDSVLQIDASADEPLRRRIDALFAQQRNTWPALREGEAALAHLRRKTLTIGEAAVVVQMNPARRRSTFAQIDPKAIAGRACFLCPENMPAEERGVAFEDLVVLPNPYPILPLHCTIAGREHRPQQMAGRVGALLRLAQAIGPDMAAMYNGPRCGASAPDHLHFQAASAKEIPILAQVPAMPPGRPVQANSSFSRNMLVFGATNASQVEAGIEASIEALRRIMNTNDEPMFNLLAHYQDGRHTAILFPRAAHRPSCYFKTGPEKIAVSPAVLEMCGILVITEPDDFDRIDADAARAIYVEVSIAADAFERLMAIVAS